MPFRSVRFLCLALLGLQLCSRVDAQLNSFVVRAGRIMPVAADLPWELENGLLIVRDGRIVAIGTDLEMPPDLPLLDLPDATIVPGLVAAASEWGGSHRGDESIAAGYLAVDAFDRYGDYQRTLAQGVTTVHVNPGTHRLLTGQGAVVRLAGDAAQRILDPAADLTINLGAPRPPLAVTYTLPASADVAIDPPVRQRPASRIGQFLALEEAVQRATAPRQPSEVQDPHDEALAAAWHGGKPLRISAERAADLLGAVRFLRQWQRGGYLVGAQEAEHAAGAIRDAGVALVLQPPARFSAAGSDVGLDPAALSTRDFDYESFQDLPVAIAPANGVAVGDLRMLAVLASRRGLEPRRALEAITRIPAEILGVADRVGSLEPGKDADFVVLNGGPLDVSSHVRQVFIQGVCVFEPPRRNQLVIKAAMVWVKPDLQIPQGEILVEDGKIVAVGRSVPHPPWADVIDVRPDGFVTPGFIDAFSHLGLEGDRTGVDTAVQLSKLVGAADVTDLRVCGAGVTTVLVAPYSVAAGGSLLAAIKTAGIDRETRVLNDPAAVIFDVSTLDPLAVAETLGKPLEAGKRYLDSWVKYETDLKAFLEKKEKGEQAKSQEPAANETRETRGPDPITGTWEVVARGIPLRDVVTVNLQLQLLGTQVQGRIVGAASSFSGTLSGTFAAGRLSAQLDVEGIDVPGPLRIEADVTGEDHFRGTIGIGELSFPLEGRRVDKSPVEVVVTRRVSRTEDGRPLPPKINATLEPIRALWEKKIPALVKASTPAQIREVLDLLVDKHELPVTLLDAQGAAVHAGRLREKQVTVVVPAQLRRTRQYQDYLQADDLTRQGVSIAFQSDAEDGGRHLPAVVLQGVVQGLDAEQALAALTIAPAKAFRIDQRVGSLEPGKDADLVIFSGHPFQDAGQVLRVIVSGQEVRP